MHGYAVGKRRPLWFPEGASDYILRTTIVIKTKQANLTLVPKNPTKYFQFFSINNL